MSSLKNIVILITGLFLCVRLWMPIEQEKIAFDSKFNRQDSATSFLNMSNGRFSKTHTKPITHHHSGTLQSRQLQELYLLADFLFHSVGFEFLGGQTQPVSDPLSILLQSIHDSCTLQCEERSQLMIQICQRSFGIKGRMVIIPGHHSYPVFTIGKKEYIIDPYDPLYFLSPLDHHILTWEELHQSNNYIIVRTRRHYGPSKELISRNLAEKFELLGLPSKAQQKQLLRKTLDTLNFLQNDLHIEIPKHQPRQLSQTHSDQYPLKLDLWDRQDGDLHIPESYGLPKRNKQPLIYIEQ